MIKADVGKPESFTNFEELKATVDILKEVVDEHAEIFRANDLVRTEEIQAPYFNEDKLYRELEEE